MNHNTVCLQSCFAEMQVGLLLPPQDRTNHRYLCVADAAHPKAMENASVLKLASVAYIKFNGNINRDVQQRLLQLDQNYETICSCKLGAHVLA